MTITHYEKSGSRTGSITAKGGSVDIIYVVEGSSEDHEIYKYLVDELDNEHIGLPAKIYHWLRLNAKIRTNG